METRTSSTRMWRQAAPLPLVVFALSVAFGSGCVEVESSNAAPASSKTVSSTQEVDLEWVRQFGTAADDAAQDIAVTDESVYVLSTTSVDTEDATNGFLRKYDDDGDLIWSRDIFGRGVAANSEEVYVVSESSIAKFDSNGDRLWGEELVVATEEARQRCRPGSDSTCSSVEEVARTVAVADDGVYVAGQLRYSLTVQPFVRDEAFIQKLSSDGEELWTQRYYPRGANGRVQSIAVDDTGVYAVGATALYVGPGPSAFVSRLATDDGDLIWDINLLPTSRRPGEATGVAVDDGTVYIVGGGFGEGGGFVQQRSADGSFNWERMINGSRPTSVAALADGVLIAAENLYRYEANGSLTWSSRLASDGVALPFAVDESQDAFYFAGETNGSFAGQTNAGGVDAFVAKLAIETEDPPQNLEWLNQFGTPNHDVAAAVTTDDGSSYVVGALDSEDALTSPVLISDVDGQAGFLRKYDANGSLLWTRELDEPARGVTAHEQAVFLAGTDLRRYSPDGDLVWVKNFEIGPEGDPLGEGPIIGTRNTANSITIRNGFLYVAGESFVGLRVGTTDRAGGFVQRYSLDGQLLWTAEEVFFANNAGATDIAVSDDAVYASGEAFRFVGAGVEGALLVKLSLDGEVLWEQIPFRFGTADAVEIHGDAVFLAGETFGEFAATDLTGFVQRLNTSGDVVWEQLDNNFFPNDLAVIDGSLVAAGGPNILLREYDLNGNINRTRQLGPDGAGVALGLAAGEAIYIAGVANDALGDQASAGGQDAFLGKLAFVAEEPPGEEPPEEPPGEEPPPEEPPGEEPPEEPPVGDCVTIEGDVVINSQADIDLLSGIDGCFEIAGGLFVQQTNDVTSLDFLSGLRSVGGYVGMSDNAVLQSLVGLGDLEFIGKGLVIEGNPSLQTVTALTALRALEGPLHIFGNPSLALVDIPLLVSVEQPANENLAAMVIGANDALVEVSLPTLQFIGGDADIENNDVLAVLAMTALDSVEGLFRIAYNISLPTCVAQALVDAVEPADVTGAIVIEGNDDKAVCPL